MKTGINSLETLIENLGEEWKQLLDDYSKNITENFPTEFESAVSDFFNNFKEDIISNNTRDLNLIEKKIANDLLYNNIYNYVRESLSTYYIAAPMRSLATKDKDKTIKLIQDIFEKAILRFNPEIISKYENYGFPNQDSFIEFLNMFDSFCSFMVERNFDYSAIENVVYTSFRFPKETCKQISKYIDDNFHQIKINYIIDKLKEWE